MSVVDFLFNVFVVFLVFLRNFFYALILIGITMVS